MYSGGCAVVGGEVMWGNGGVFGVVFWEEMWGGLWPRAVAHFVLLGVAVIQNTQCAFCIIGHRKAEGPRGLNIC
jgi:hypothetical protein